jgi:hypothetical protein
MLPSWCAVGRIGVRVCVLRLVCDAGDGQRIGKSYKNLSDQVGVTFKKVRSCVVPVQLPSSGDETMKGGKSRTEVTTLLMNFQLTFQYEVYHHAEL